MALVQTNHVAQTEELVSKIEGIILDIVTCIAENRTPKYTMLSRSRLNVKKSKDGIEIGDERVAVEMFGRKGASALRFAKVIQVMSLVYKLLKSGNTVTQRDAYYTLSGSFSSQHEFNTCFADVTRILDVPRKVLGVIAAPKGSVAGCIKIQHGNEDIDCLLLGKSGYELPGDPSDLKFESLGARYILVVEKDAVFKTLCDNLLWNEVPCVIVTGRGYPGLAVREIVSRLEQDFKLPVLGLFDYNPHGVQILMTYRFGSARMGREGVQYTCGVQWLGLHWYDIQNVKPDHFKNFTKKDTQLCNSLLSQPFINQHQKYWNEVAQLKRHQVKLELECIEDIKAFIVNKIHKKMFFTDSAKEYYEE